MYFALRAAGKASPVCKTGSAFPSVGPATLSVNRDPRNAAFSRHATTAEVVLQELRGQGRRLTDAVADHVEQTASEHLEAVAPELERIADNDTNAVQEARTFVIAHAGRSLAPRWKANGKQTLERFSDPHPTLSQDGTLLKALAGDDPRLQQLEQKVRDLAIHDDFDQKLVGLLAAVYDAETILDEKATQSEPLPDLQSRRAVND